VLQTFADILTFEGEERLPMITMMIGMVKMWGMPMMMVVVGRNYRYR